MERTQEILKQLVAFGKESDGNIRLAEYVETLLKSYGLDPVLDRTEDGKNANVILRIGSANAGGILLSAHTDVVSAGNLAEWKTDPWELREKNGLYFGRGVLDNLGAIAALLSALPSWVHNVKEGKLKKPLYILLSHSEEPDRNGLRSRGIASAVRHLFDEMRATPELVLVTMPTGNEVISRHSGQVVGCTVTCATTGGFAFDTESQNALEVAALILAALAAQKAELRDRGIKSLAPTDIFNSTKGPLFVPERTVMTFDVRTKPNITSAEIVGILQAVATKAINKIADSTSIQVAVSGMNPGFQCDSEKGISLALRLAEKTQAMDGVYATEAFNFTPVNTVVLGPGRILGDSTKGMGGAHTPNEGIEKDGPMGLRAFKDILLKNIAHFCGSDGLKSR